MAKYANTIFGQSQGYDLKTGNIYESVTPTTLYPRLANKKKWQIENCIGFKINDINKAGRRFTCEFFDAKRNTIDTRRVYREYVEAMIDQLGLTVPEVIADESVTTDTPVVTAPKPAKSSTPKKATKASTPKVSDDSDVVTEPMEFA